MCCVKCFTSIISFNPLNSPAIPILQMRALRKRQHCNFINCTLHQYSTTSSFIHFLVSLLTVLQVCNTAGLMNTSADLFIPHRGEEIWPYHRGRSFQNPGLRTGKTSQREINKALGQSCHFSGYASGKCIMDESAALGEKQQINTFFILELSLAFLVKL